MAVSAPIEAKDELAETGLEALGAQPVADAPSPALEVAERGVDPGENLMGGLSPTTWGRWRSRGTALQPLQPSVLTIAVAAVLRTAKLPRSLALQDRTVASRWHGEAWRRASRRCDRTRFRAASATRTKPPDTKQHTIAATGPDSEPLLQLQGGDAVAMSGHQTGGPEPDRERQPGSVQIRCLALWAGIS